MSLVLRVLPASKPLINTGWANRLQGAPRAYSAHDGRVARRASQENQGWDLPAWVAAALGARFGGRVRRLAVHDQPGGGAATAAGRTGWPSRSRRLRRRASTALTSLGGTRHVALTPFAGTPASGASAGAAALDAAPPAPGPAHRLLTTGSPHSGPAWDARLLLGEASATLIRAHACPCGTQPASWQTACHSCRGLFLTELQIGGLVTHSAEPATERDLRLGMAA